MTVGKAIYYLLTNSTDVTDIVSTRVYPEIAEQNAALPYVVYNIANNEPTDTKPEPSKLDTAQIEVNVYSESYTECIDLSVAVRAALDRVKGTYNGVNVQSIQYVNEIIDFDEPQRAYNIAADYDVRISRSDFEIAQGSPITGVTLGELNDVSISLPSDGEVLIYSGGEFVNDNIAISSVTGLQSELDGIPDSIFDLNDVGQSGGSIAANSTLKYIDGQWTNSAPEAPTPVYDELSDLTDTTITTPTDNQFLRYNGTKWVNETVVQYHGRFDSEAETLLDGATATVELYYTAQADGDGLHEDAQSDTATSGYDIQRKLYYSEAAQADPDTGTWVQFTAIADNTSYASAKATLLAYLKERTGGTVPISLKMTWEEVAQAPSFTGLLNESYGSGAEAAYSTRRLNGNYTGDCMTIRRASDGTTTSIGFVGEEIDESAIETFCTGTTCTVQVWRDQSGNGNDATQTTAANQPTIYTGGQLVKEGGRLALDFDGSGDCFDVSAFGSALSLPNSTFTVGKADATGTFYLYGGASGTENNVRARGLTSTWEIGNPTFQNTGIAYDTNTHIFTGIHNTSATLFVDGNSSGALSGAGSESWQDVNIGSRYSDFTWNGKQQEFIIYNSDKSTDRTSIESNIGDYFTQNTPLLDTYSGAAAAYSLRKLRTAYTGDAVEVYNGSSYADIGFNVFGELDTVALAAHCGSNNGFVSKWYDQSGNSNTAAQTTTSNMPKIYDGTTGVVTENGKPAVDLIDTSDFLNVGLSLTQPCSIFSANKAEYTGAFSLISRGGIPGIWYGYHQGGQYGVYAGSWLMSSGTSNQRLDAFFIDGANTELYQNNSLLTSGNPGTANSTGNNIGHFQTNQNFTGTIQELIIYNSDQSSNRTNIEDNINTFYSIY